MVNNNGDNNAFTTTFDPTKLVATTITSGSLLGYSEKYLQDLSASEFLEAFRNSELVKLQMMVEDARLLYEEEADDASFGEYQGLKTALEWLEATLMAAPSKIYSVRTPYANGGTLQAPGAWYIPQGHTGIR